MARRCLDLLVAALLTITLWPVFIVVCIVLLVAEGRPLFYVSERMKGVDEPFRLIKFRTMKNTTDDQNTGVTGGDKSKRVSAVHRFLRRTRADELPQIWNVFKGDIALVGPRPPLRVYVSAYPELYAKVLRDKPGVTGLASLVFHKTEERLLAECKTPEETDEVYRRRCIPRKARLDLIYQQERTLCSDLRLIGLTAAKPFKRE